ncbi:MAG: hypothetical protein AAFR77_11165, partial [Cyanobacteria bacterium J06631_2]
SLFKQELLTKLESSLSELTTAKISRSDLAEILFELCLNLKGQENPTEMNISQQDLAMLGEEQDVPEMIPPEIESS